MIGKGWNGTELDEMSEEEFLTIFDAQVDFDRAKAEAEEKAVRKASRT